VSWRPVLNVVCGRCGKPRGLAHTCISSSRRKATITPKVSFGTCPRCRKPQGNPTTHTCQPKTDFKRRRAAAGKQHAKDARAQAASIAKVKRARQGGGKPKHDYQACTDEDCRRPLCVAFKTGYLNGHRDGFEEGWQVGYNVGFPEGQAACPRSHK
jgi:hypothetical protein